ncbi:hypothetical protein BDQ12DRAFT_252565 [Crucibulum laeve]|uniref:Uncharacterized protein n=1 Tax=Crucibulum laeve TaxID=68775 RepID=A0A5C3LSR9_9AGAR|nr:hypothetical protein BDQ12DRAFT_252565 [Crucibulum laeve]
MRPAFVLYLYFETTRCLDCLKRINTMLHEHLTRPTFILTRIFSIRVAADARLAFRMTTHAYILFRSSITHHLRAEYIDNPSFVT